MYLFAGFKPKCKTDFLPWFHNSELFIRTCCTLRAKGQGVKEINCSQQQWLHRCFQLHLFRERPLPPEVQPVRFEHTDKQDFISLLFKTENTILLSPTVLEVMKFSICCRSWGWLGLPQCCSRENYFLALVVGPTLNEPMFWWRACTKMVRKSHIREPGCYWMLLKLLLTTLQAF